MGRSRREGARLRVLSVADLRGRGEVTSVGVTGFCMGGTFALLLPCHTRLEAAAPFYGDVPPTPRSSPG